MPDTFSPLLQLLLQGTGDNSNTWGTLCNTETITPIENAICGVTTLTNASGTVDLTTFQRMQAIIDLRATLTGNVVLVDQFGTSKTWWFYNGCTLGGFTVQMKTTSGTPVT